MSLIITDDCINCDVCEPECPNSAITQGEENVSATMMNRNACRCAQWIASHWMLIMSKVKTS